jgi:single-strand DNA-binding protein
MTNINRVVLTGNLTADPELRPLPSGSSVGRLRLAVNTRRKNSQSGAWEEKANYFDVTVWGAQAENCAQYLAKGRPVAVDGRLEWREYTTQDGQKRQAVEVIADSVQFLGTRDQANGNGTGNTSALSSAMPTPGDTGDFDATPATAGTASDDDIPF